MAIDILTPAPADGQLDGIDPGSKAYAELGAERVELPPLARENFTDQASDIFGTIQQARVDGQPIREGYRRATEAYVNDAEDPRMALQADLILSAPGACESSRRNQELKLRKDLTPEERQEKRAHARIACEYNRGLRQLIADNHDSFTRADLHNWLEKGSGNSGWADKIITGVAAEAAVIKLVSTLDGVTVDPGTVEDDLKGVDFTIVRADGRRVPVDVKYGDQHTYDGEGPMIIPIDTNELEGLSITPSLAPGVKRRIQALL